MIWDQDRCVVVPHSKITREERQGCIAFLHEVAEWARVRNLSVVATERLRVAELIREGSPINLELLRAGRAWLKRNAIGAGVDGFENRTFAPVNALGP